jgi:aminoglycoside phosphotransferase (APT) family kinase protein
VRGHRAQLDAAALRVVVREDVVAEHVVALPLTDRLEDPVVTQCALTPLAAHGVDHAADRRADARFTGPPRSELRALAPRRALGARGLASGRKRRQTPREYDDSHNHDLCPHTNPLALALAARRLRIVTESGALREQLAAVVGDHLGDAVRIEDLEPLLGGASRELWAFELVVGEERRRAVLRRDPAGVGDPAGRRREWEALRAAYDNGVAVPEPLWFVEGGADGEGTGFVMERLDGEAIPRRLLRDEAYEAARIELPAQIAAAAARTHAIALSDVAALATGEGHPAAAGIAALEAELDRLGQPHPALELGLRWLRRNLPEPSEPALVHGDFRLGNFLCGPDGLVAVLDWELCHAGDPVEDLGWLCIRSWRFGNDDRPVAGMGDRDALLAAYADAGGREVSRAELRFWEVFGNVRWGVICVLQADAHLSGAMHSLERAAIGRRTCEPEWDTLAMIGSAA